MKALYFFESIRNPICDFFFAAITHLGGETVFLAAAILFLWCIDKRYGYFILFSCFFGALINQVLKLCFRVPRPWVRDPNFTIVEAARADATGYSFPSGHTQNAVGLFGAMGLFFRKSYARVLCVGLILLVALSRMYLGAHTPTDVVASLLIGLPLLAVLSHFFSDEERYRKSILWFCLAAYALTAVYLSVVVLWNDPRLDAQNLASAREVAATFHGCAAGILIVHVLDRRLIRFSTDAPWYAQVLKATLGLAVVLLLKEGMKMPLSFLFGDAALLARGVRYFLVVLFAGGVWPLTFRFWSSLRIPCLERLWGAKKQ